MRRRLEGRFFLFFFRFLQASHNLYQMRHREPRTKDYFVASVRYHENFHAWRPVHRTDGLERLIYLNLHTFPLVLESIL